VNSDSKAPIVLLVERPSGLPDRIGGWLERAGFDVLTCPGPSGPDFDCVGSRTGQCPLVHGADVIVLDLWLDSDRAMRGIGGHSLLRHYGSTGIPVVALTHGPEPSPLVDQPGVAEVGWPPDARELVETVRALLR
jgi:DNA-binding response OmpR family regulator